LGWYQTYQYGAPPPVQVQQPSYSDSYNQGYMDGFNEAHGLIGRHGYGTHYDEGYKAARQSVEATYQLNRPAY
jgi:hypothetical protein